MEETLSLATVPRHALTVAEYLELGEDGDGPRYELVEGNLTMTPSGAPRHGAGQVVVAAALLRSVPSDLKVASEVDVDLQLVAPDGPGTVRRPDVLVVTRNGYDRVGDEGGLVRAGDVRLAVEIVSPSSRRTDRMVKLAEYRDAGVPRYWIVDLEDGPSLTVCTLAGGEYERRTYRGTVTLAEPFAVTVDLDSLA